VGIVPWRWIRGRSAGTILAVEALSQAEFEAMSGPMRELASRDAPRVGLSAYRGSIPDDDGVAFGHWPDHFLETTDGRFVHVLFTSDDPDVVLAVVVDRQRQAIVGHRILDANTA
jgi:hypothetical protein